MIGLSTMVPHLVLLGDSIFDNGSYVGKGNPSVIDQLQSRAQTLGWKASSVAVDGNIISDISKQLTRIPKDASHLFISVGKHRADDYRLKTIHDWTLFRRQQCSALHVLSRGFGEKRR
jgi:hypothetical protein